MILRMLLVVAAAALLAGCGGGDGGEKRVDKVSSCLKKAYGDFVSTDRTDLDPIGAQSKDGAVTVSTASQQANISLHKTVAVAEEALKLYRAGRTPPKKVERHGTAVVAYTANPTAQEERTIGACVQES